MKKIVLGFLALMVSLTTFAQLPGGKLNLFKYEDKTVSLRVNGDSTFLNLANGVLYSVDTTLYLPANTLVNGLPLALPDTTSLSQRIDAKLDTDKSATDYARDIHIPDFDTFSRWFL
ncbi:hypothetical protein AGMMS49965_13270 [Bacteroidia bacterium]|nr:hypothetical protein AGMMS49965_13270 [Bacteroidia bacterium]